MSRGSANRMLLKLRFNGLTVRAVTLIVLSTQIERPPRAISPKSDQVV